MLYLHGLSTGDFVPALEQFLGSAVGLSSATVSRLTAPWTEDHKAFQARDLSKTDFVYVWADGVHLKVRLDEARACVLVMVGVSRRWQQRADSPGRGLPVGCHKPALFCDLR